MTVRRPHGFTLIEVMVALAITAIALMAGLQATGALTRNATRQSDVLLAQLCADNALAQLRLLRQLPAIGDTALVNDAIRMVRRPPGSSDSV